MTLAIRGGGHSIAGLQLPTGGMLIDLADMRGVHVDPEREPAVVQGGALWADVDRETQAYGLVAPGGVVSDTGVAGLTLGGGYGWVRRKYGLTVDQLVEAEVVTADGRSSPRPTTEPRPLLGAQGRRRQLRRRDLVHVRPEPARPARRLLRDVLPARGVRRRSCAAGATTPTGAPDEVSSLVVTLTFPADPDMPAAIHDRAVAIVGGVHAGDPRRASNDGAAARAGHAALRHLGPGAVHRVQSGFDPLFPRGALRAFWKSQYLDALTDGAIDTLTELAHDRPAPLTLVEVIQMGGAIAKVDPEATAFSQRAAPYLVSVDGIWADAGRRRRQRSPGSAPPGTPSRSSATARSTSTSAAAPARRRSAGRDTALRPQPRPAGEIKAKYDPDNSFRVNHNIRPA